MRRVHVDSVRPCAYANARTSEQSETGMHVQNIALAATLALLSACAGADAQLTCVLTGQCVRSPEERAADDRAEAVQLAAQKDAAERRRLVARQATLRDQLANQRLTVNRLRREVAEQQGRLGASETRLAAVSAELSQVAVVEPEFLLMGEVTCMEPSGAMCVRGNLLHTGGPTIDRPMFPAFILLDPQPGDVLGGRIVSAKHVHFRGYHKGVNGFGGPITGVVVSDKMTKTRVVAVSRIKKHPRYLKYLTITTRFKAHDEANEYHTGDKVVIEETRPLSKEERWKIVEKISNS